MAQRSSISIPASELSYQFARSSGPGGQNVNKVSSKATVWWDFSRSRILDAEQKARLREKAERQCVLNSAGELFASDQSSRSQAENKARARSKLEELAAKLLRQTKRRRSTAVPGSTRVERLRTKHTRSERIKSRKITE